MAEKGNANISIDRVAINAVANLATALNNEISDQQIPALQAQVMSLSEMIDGEDAQKVKDLFQDAIDAMQTSRENFGKFSLASTKIAKAMDSSFEATARTLDAAGEELQRAKGQLANRAAQ